MCRGTVGIAGTGLRRSSGAGPRRPARVEILAQRRGERAPHSRAPPCMVDRRCRRPSLYRPSHRPLLLERGRRRGPGGLASALSRSAAARVAGLAAAIPATRLLNAASACARPARAAPSVASSGIAASSAACAAIRPPRLGAGDFAWRLHAAPRRAPRPARGLHRAPLPRRSAARLVLLAMVHSSIVPRRLSSSASRAAIASSSSSSLRARRRRRPSAPPRAPGRRQVRRALELGDRAPPSRSRASLRLGPIA